MSEIHEIIWAIVTLILGLFDKFIFAALVIGLLVGVPGAIWARHAHDKHQQE